MDSPKTTDRKRGRPSSGKKAYTVRMPTDAYRALCSAARDDGFDHLGDWLAQLPGLLPGGSAATSSGRLGPRLARRRFVAIAEKTCELTDALHDLTDRELSIVHDDAVVKAVSILEASYRKLNRFITHEAGLKRGNTGKPMAL